MLAICVKQAISIPRDAAVNHFNPSQLTLRAAVVLYGSQGICPGKVHAFVQLGVPAQTCFKHIDRVRNLVPIERHGGLKPQSIARAQAAWHYAEFLASFQYLVPHACAGWLVRGDIDLKTVFAGVAGARNHDVVQAADLTPAKPIVFDLIQLQISQLLQHIHRFGPLNGQLRVHVGVVRNMTLEGLSLLPNPLMILLTGSSVDNDQIVVVREFMHHDVIDKCALGVQHGRVVGLANLQLGRIVHGELLHRVERLGTAQLDVAHVAHIEEAHARANCHVLGCNTGIFDRHVPTAEVDHFGAESAMDSIERGLAKCGFSSRHAVPR